jgi:hypothetical protein
MLALGNTILPARQQAVALVLALLILFAVVELVRKRKLREEYAFLWIGTAVLLIVLALTDQPLLWVKDLIGADQPVSALFLGALLFLMLLALQFSVRLSRLTWRLKTLAQRLALLEKEIDVLRGRQRRDLRSEKVVDSQRDDVA